MRRLQKEHILRDLKKKMVFIVGPRQVGKTWLAKDIMKSYEEPVYLNFDGLKDRKVIMEQSWYADSDLIIFDEIHKMREWKNYIKGVFDTKKDFQQIIVTGSARLESFRKTGDSLAGRYFLHHLLPFSLKELENTELADSLDLLIGRGGFPEPLLSDPDISGRWRNQYTESLLRYDIVDFQNISHIRNIELLFNMIRDRVGSPISFKSLAEDIQISPITVKKYLHILEDLFIVFRVSPFSRNIARAVQKSSKYYFFDNGLVNGDIGKKFENLVAIHLLKHCYAKTDYTGIRTELKYIRTKEKKEVDFCIVEDNRPVILIEVKSSDTSVAPNLRFFSEKYNIRGVQLVKNIKRQLSKNGIDIRDAKKFLKELYL